MTQYLSSKVFETGDTLDETQLVEFVVSTRQDFPGVGQEEGAVTAARHSGDGGTFGDLHLGNAKHQTGNHKAVLTNIHVLLCVLLVKFLLASERRSHPRIPGQDALRQEIKDKGLKRKTKVRVPRKKK